MISSRDLATVKQAYEAWNAGDLEALERCYAINVTADAGTLWPAAGEIAGREAVFRQFGSIFDTFEHNTLVAEELIECEGDAIVVPTRWRGSLRGSETMIEQRLVAAYHMRYGRIAHVAYFTDLDAALATVGSRLPQRQASLNQSSP